MELPRRHARRKAADGPSTAKLVGADVSVTAQGWSAIEDKPGPWKRVTQEGEFGTRYRLSGDTLKRAPAGFDPNHPMIEDLKRRDHVGVAMLDERTVTSEDFLPEYAELCRAAVPYARFLCEAVGVPF